MKVYGLCFAFLFAICALLSVSSGAPPDTTKTELLAQQPPPPPPAKKSFGSSAEDGRSVVAQPPSVVLPEAPAAAKSENFLLGSRRSITIRERRELGINPLNAMRIHRELREAGEIDNDTPPEQVSAAIAARIKSDNPQAFKAAGGTKLAEFIQALLELLERWLPLFADLFG